MAAIAGLQDFRQEGPPGDIGVFQGAASIIVYHFTFSGTTYTVAQRMGVSGWTLVDQGTVANTVINMALTIIGIAGGGMLFLKAGIYILLASISIPAGKITIRGEGWASNIRAGFNGSIITTPQTSRLTDIIIEDLGLEYFGGNTGKIIDFIKVDLSIISGCYLASGTNAIDLTNSLTNTIRNNYIETFSGTFIPIGNHIGATSSNMNRIYDNRFNSTAANQTMIDISDGTQNIITRNDFSNFTAGTSIAINIDFGIQNKVENNYFEIGDIAIVTTVNSLMNKVSGNYYNTVTTELTIGNVLAIYGENRGKRYILVTAAGIYAVSQPYPQGSVSNTPFIYDHPGANAYVANTPVTWYLYDTLLTNNSKINTTLIGYTGTAQITFSVINNNAGVQQEIQIVVVTGANINTDLYFLLEIMN